MTWKLRVAMQGISSSDKVVILQSRILERLYSCGSIGPRSSSLGSRTPIGLILRNPKSTSVSHAQILAKFWSILMNDLQPDIAPLSRRMSRLRSVPSSQIPSSPMYELQPPRLFTFTNLSVALWSIEIKR